MSGCSTTWRLLGFAREDVLKRIPPPSAAALAGAQYYWIRHVHPVALLGFIAVLEGTPPDVAFFEATADRIGVPRQGIQQPAAPWKARSHSIATTWTARSMRFRSTDEHHSLMGISAFQTINLLTRVASEAVQ